MDATHGFVASLSDGNTAAEHKEQWKVIEGQRKPWVRLGDFLLSNKLWITGLRYNANGTTYHAPKLDTRFNKGGQHPDWYSLEYIYEREEGFDGVTESLYADIGSYYGDDSVHLIIEIGGQQNVFVQHRRGYKAMASAPGKEL